LQVDEQRAMYTRKIRDLEAKLKVRHNNRTPNGTLGLLLTCFACAEKLA
jgi:hypothetical protein